ncbi:hypothetical protein RHMOL_Rhmol05G0030900 [Rhododendron molle]|uniref:Uncharacterized protein n=1 Tax=Rhododendron molle TaxID=49168 RepID=A0ACC0NMB5_RHOML|nr:hypothetical protein RHMOL_Rhmol05G0030900 [Rhododendron molle]
MKYLERVVFIAWYIWKARNEVVFNSGLPNPEWTMRRALEAFREFSDAVVPSRFHMDNPTVEDFISQWRAPENGCFKLNCDATVGKNGEEASAAVVIRDNNGILVNGSAVLTSVSSSLQGELVAIRQACGMISDLGYQNALVESDSQVAIKLSVSELVPPWEVSAVVWDIRKMREDLNIIFGWVKRTANKLAHVVAKKALKGLLPRDWVVLPPNFISSILARDSLLRL